MTYTFKDGFEAMDFARVTGMLAGTYWSPGIQMDEVIRGASNSALLVGAFDSQNRQIAYTRVISDKTRFAYILDVIVDEQCRGQGIGQTMIHYVLAHPDLADINHWLLITKDAHEVYKKVGFQVTNRPNDWMEIRRPRRSRGE